MGSLRFGADKAYVREGVRVDEVLVHFLGIRGLLIPGIGSLASVG
jgi:hypothetical protein